MSNTIAVSSSDYKESGCVKCGCEYCYGQGISGGGTTPVVCGECETRFIILAEGLTKSRIGFGSGDGPASYPELQAHPRKGTPNHPYIRPDVKPEGGGEYWAPRGVGYDLSGFVKGKEAGERIVKMVEKGIGRTPKTWLDYRPSEPKWVQVKVQAVDGINLETLCDLCKDGIITEQRIITSLTIEALTK